MKTYPIHFSKQMLLSIAFVSVSLCPITMNGQGFLKKLKDQTTNKLSDRAAHELSEMAVEALMSPIRQKRYRMMKEQYKAQNGEDFDDSKYESPEEAEQALYASMMQFYADVELKENYSFDHQVEIEVKDERDKQKMDMLFSDSREIFGIRINDKEENGLIVIDYENDLMVTYDEDKKEAFAIKGMFQSIKNTAQYSSSEGTVSTANQEFTIKELSKNKKVADCDSKGYEVTSEEGKGEVYFCSSLPFSWKNSFGNSFQKMNPNGAGNHSFYYDYGMPVYAKFKDKEGEESSWEVKKIKAEKLIIDNSEYTLMNKQLQNK